MTTEHGFTVPRDLVALVTRHEPALRALVEDLDALDLAGRRSPVARDWRRRTEQLLGHARPPRVRRSPKETKAIEPDDLSVRVRVAAVLRSMADDQDGKRNPSAANLLRIAARELDVAERLLGSSTRDRT